MTEDHHHRSTQDEEEEDTPAAAVVRVPDDDVSSSSSFAEQQLRRVPVWHRNPAVCRTVVDTILPRWKHALPPGVWNKISKRWVKELNECEPFITYLMEKTASRTEPFVVVDIGSGFGLLSMFLSELLPPETVPAIWLLDKAFALPSTTIVKGHHITVDHLQQDKYQWPIPLRYRKVDIKKGREVRQLVQHNVFGNYPVVLVGVHLCKSLSVHAIQWFHRWSSTASHQQQQQQQAVDTTTCTTPTNTTTTTTGTLLPPQAIALLLKPCCLPGRRNLYTTNRKGPTVPLVYAFPNGYSFAPKVLYDDNSEDDDDYHRAETAVGNREVDSKQQQQQRSSSSHDSTNTRRTTNRRFSAWVEHLRRGCDSPSCHCDVRTIAIQQRHFQNQFLFCEPIPEVNNITPQQ